MNQFIFAPIILSLFLVSCKLPFTSGFETNDNSNHGNTIESIDEPKSKNIIELKSNASYFFENETNPVLGKELNRFKIVASQPAYRDITIDLSYTGTYEDHDFINLPSSVILPAGAVDVSFEIKPFNDRVTEPNKLLVIHISASDEAVGVRKNDYELTFRDDDPINLFIEPYKTNGVVSHDLGVEGDNEGIKYVMTITASDPAIINFDVIFKLKIISGNLSANDIVEDIETLVFPAGATSHTFTFHVKQDALVEGIEDSILTYELINARAKGMEFVNIRLKALDDDIVSVDISSISGCDVIEEYQARVCKILGRRSGDLNQELIVPLSFAGNAVMGNDFVAPTSVHFKSSESSHEFEVVIIDDDLIEEPEDLVVKLAKTAGLACQCETGIKFSIIDNDGSPENRSVELLASANLLNSSVTLTWLNDFNFYDYKLFRRELGEESWGIAIASLPAVQKSFVDTNVTIGKIYEYKIERNSGKGYVNVAYNRGVIHYQGRLLIVAEKNVANQLTGELEIWKDQLAGDGWDVTTETVSVTDSVMSVKQKIVTQHLISPLRAVVLFGHVPVPYSGLAAPDGHPEHIGAWPADAFYGDVESQLWTDTTVTIQTPDRPQNWNIPGDGKFDNSLLPSKVEIAVGRIDLYDMPAFSPLTEVALLKRYLMKVSNYRNVNFNPVRRALVDDNFGDFFTESFSAGARNFMSASVGEAQVFSRDFKSELGIASYLWAYGCGPGTYDGAGGVATTSELASQALNAVFVNIFGSYFGDWDSTNNFLRAPLAAEGQALTSTWSGRPNWVYYSLASGEPMATAIVQTLNHSKTYFPYSYDNVVSTAFMGDPTLRDYAITPVKRLSAIKNRDMVDVSWSPGEPVDGYFIYTSKERHRGYKLVNSVAATGLSYTIRGDVNDKFVLVKAVKKVDGYGGIFQNLSVGSITALPQ